MSVEVISYLPVIFRPVDELEITALFRIDLVIGQCIAISPDRHAGSSSGIEYVESLQVAIFFEV